MSAAPAGPPPTPTTDPAATTAAAPDSPALADWTRRAQAGDAAAFSALVARYRPAMVQQALGYVRDPDVAEGLVQDALLRAWLAIGRTARGLRVRPWLYRITANVCLDHVRHDRLIGWVSLGAAAGGGQPLAPRGRATAPDRWRRWEATGAGDDPVAGLVAGEIWQALSAALARLPARERRVLLLRLAGRSYKEIGATLGATLAMVKSLLHRARVAVQQDAGVRALGLGPRDRDLPLWVYRVRAGAGGGRGPRQRAVYAAQQTWQGRRVHVGQYRTVAAAVAGLAAWRAAHGLPARAARGDTRGVAAEARP